MYIDVVGVIPSSCRFHVGNATDHCGSGVKYRKGNPDILDSFSNVWNKPGVVSTLPFLCRSSSELIDSTACRCSAVYADIPYAKNRLV